MNMYKCNLSGLDDCALNGWDADGSLAMLKGVAEMIVSKLRQPGISGNILNENYHMVCNGLGVLIYNYLKETSDL